MRPTSSCGTVVGLIGATLVLIPLVATPARAREAEAAQRTAAPVDSTAAAVGDSQRQAKALLQGMARYLADLPEFSVKFRDGYDVVQPSGQKIEFGESRSVALARPDRLRVEEISSDGTRDVAIFDGSHISTLDADAAVFAQVPQPGSVDDSIAYFVRSLRMRMPLALLLSTQLPQVLERRTTTVDYVERTEILGVPAHHVAGQTEQVDFQFWIKEGDRPLPLRVVITYRDAPGQPQFWASFLDWNTAPDFPPETFRFTPPPDARQIAFAVQVRPAGSPPAAAGRGTQP